jgi:hypothetical protein
MQQIKHLNIKVYLWCSPVVAAPVCIRGSSMASVVGLLPCTRRPRVVARLWAPSLRPWRFRWMALAICCSSELRWHGACGRTSPTQNIARLCVVRSGGNLPLEFVDEHHFSKSNQYPGPNPPSYLKQPSPTSTLGWVVAGIVKF